MLEGVAGVRGVLRPEGAAGRFTLARLDPEPGLAPFIDWFWIVRWDLRGQSAYEQSILPHPNVHLAFESDGPRVHGVDTRIFSRRLSGAGTVLGIRFRPGCFRPFCDGPASSLTDKIVAAATYFGQAVEEANEAIMAARADEEMAAIATALLRAAAPPPDPVGEQVAEMVGRIASDRELRTVGQLTDQFEMGERMLQRLFAQYVGVSPKWVIRRARLHEAALRADSGEEIDWAALASDLGYADQSHLTRDFTATLGVPPARYASRYPPAMLV